MIDLLHRVVVDKRSAHHSRTGGNAETMQETGRVHVLIDRFVDFRLGQDVDTLNTLDMVIPIDNRTKITP